MKKIFYFILFDFLWLLGFILVFGFSFYPLAFAGKLIRISYGINALIFSFPLLLFVFVNLYILVCGLLFRIFVPKLKEGYFDKSSRQYYYWKLNWHFYSYVFFFLSKYLFYNRTINYVYLRLMRVNLKYSSYLAELVDLQDANNLINIGKNSFLGSEVLISAHLTLGKDKMIFKKIVIGDNAMISARVGIAPGVTIGNNVIIGFNTLLSINVSVGDETKVGANVVIDSNAKIGKKCKIGSHVTIKENAELPDNSIVKDYMVIS